MQRRMRIAGLGLTSLVVLSACTNSGSSTSRKAGGGVDAGIARWCRDLIGLQSSEPEVPAGASEADAQKAKQRFFEDKILPGVKALRATAPDAAKESLDSIVSLLQQQGPKAFESDAFAQHNTALNAAAITACDAKAVDVTAVDYAYNGVPTTIEAGPVGFRFANAGSEVHEMVVLRKNDNVTEPFDQIFSLPRDEAEKKVQPFGGYFARPGGRDVRIVNLAPGNYVLACFVALGSKPEALDAGQKPDGPPHVTRGMKREFVVT